MEALLVLVHNKLGKSQVIRDATGSENNRKMNKADLSF